MNEFMKNRRVFITGINGFVGSNIAKELISLGAKVWGVDKDMDKQSLLKLEGLDKKAHCVEGLIQDFDLMEKLVRENQIEIIFHLAAEIEVGRSEEETFLTFETNIKGTYNICEVAKRHAIKALVVASTDKAYGHYESHKMPYREDYELRPKHIYETSKAAGDMVACSYARNKKGLPVVVTRFCNIYGPGQLNKTALFPDLILNTLNEGEFIPRSNGLMKRDFVFIDDVTKLYLVIAEQLVHNPKKYAGEVFNFGTNREHEIKAVIKKILELMGKGDVWSSIEQNFTAKNDSVEIDTQFMDYKKVESYFDFKPLVELEEGVEKSVDWYSRYKKAIAN